MWSRARLDFQAFPPRRAVQGLRLPRAGMEASAPGHAQGLGFIECSQSCLTPLRKRRQACMLHADVPWGEQNVHCGGEFAGTVLEQAAQRPVKSIAGGLGMSGVELWSLLGKNAGNATGSQDLSDLKRLCIDGTSCAGGARLHHPDTRAGSCRRGRGCPSKGCRRHARQGVRNARDSLKN